MKENLAPRCCSFFRSKPTLLSCSQKIAEEVISHWTSKANDFVNDSNLRCSISGVSNIESMENFSENSLSNEPMSITAGSRSAGDEPPSCYRNGVLVELSVLSQNNSYVAVEIPEDGPYSVSMSRYNSKNET